jgi:hypothetical protein
MREGRHAIHTGWLANFYKSRPYSLERNSAQYGMMEPNYQSVKVMLRYTAICLFCLVAIAWSKGRVVPFADITPLEKRTPRNVELLGAARFYRSAFVLTAGFGCWLS